MKDTTLTVGAYGIVVDEYGQVLMVRRDDSRTWAPPGGGVDADEMPPDAAAREVEEETGLKVLPLRLIGLHYMRLWRNEYLSFGFRCLRRGGELTPSRETPAVGFYNPAQPPGRIASSHRQRLIRGLTHDGAQPYWGTQRPALNTTLTRGLLLPFVYRYMDWQRWRRGEPPYRKPRGWTIETRLIARNEADEVLWLRGDDGAWRLPGARRARRAAPWDAATRVMAGWNVPAQLEHFAGATVAAHNHMTLAFTTTTLTRLPRVQDDQEAAFFPIAQPPSEAMPAHLTTLQHATQPPPLYFHRQKT